MAGEDDLAIERLVVARRGGLAVVGLALPFQCRSLYGFAAQQVHGQFLPDELEQVPHLYLALIERRLLNVLPVQALNGNGQFVCHRGGVYANFHSGPPVVSGGDQTPLCIVYGGPILRLLLYFSLHQDKITPVLNKPIRRAGQGRLTYDPRDELLSGDELLSYKGVF